MSADYEIVRYRPDHEALVVELQKELWSTDPERNRRFLEWKYERNPYLAEPLVYLALHGGRAVGMRGFHGSRWEAGTPSRGFPVLMAGDTLVSQPHRNRRLVTRIMQFAVADLAGRDSAWLLSLGASRVNVFGLLTLGWKSIGAMGPVGCTSRAAARRKRLRESVERLPLLWRYRDAGWLYSTDERQPFRHLDRAAASRRAAGAVRVDPRPRPAAMAELVARLGHDGRIRHVRDRTYLEWRFVNPLNEYRFLYHGDDRLEGYLVLQRSVSDLADSVRVHVSDLEAGSARVRRELLEKAIAWGKFPQLVTWTASLTEEQTAPLRELGFVPVDPHETTRGCPCVLVRPVATLPQEEWTLGGRALVDVANWDLRLLYSMRG